MDNLEELYTELASHMALEQANDPRYIHFSRWVNFTFDGEKRQSIFVVVRLVDLGKWGVNVWVWRTLQGEAHAITMGDDPTAGQLHMTVRSVDDVINLVRALTWMGITVHGTPIADNLNVEGNDV